MRSSPRYTFSEFGDELLVSDRYRKLVLNSQGDPLWAVDLHKDPFEQNNLVETSANLTNSWRSLLDAAHDHMHAV